MKKILFGTLMLSCISLALPGSVEAAPETAPASDSQISIDFEPHLSPTSPRDPRDPTKEGVPDDLNKKTEMAGPLSLDVVPKSFSFGQQKMYHAAHDYQARGNREERQYLQVTDNRDTEIYGWKVKVKQDHPLTDQTTKHVLTGAYLTLPAGTVHSTNSSDSKADEPSLSSKMVEITTEEQTVFEASAHSKSRASKGTATNEWEARNVSLRIPANTAQPGSYTTQLFWILSAEAAK